MKNKHQQTIHPGETSVAPTVEKSRPRLHDWHNPRDPGCTQNHDPLTGDCTCPRPTREKKAYREIRVRGEEGIRVGGPKIRDRLVVRVWFNGTIGVREHGCRREYLTTASALFSREAWAAALHRLRAGRSQGAKKRKTGKKPGDRKR